MNVRHRGRFTPTKLILLGYFVILLIGTILLMLPIASKDGTFTPVHNALFTATSATCVTGMTVYDTFTYWSTFGQVVILIMFQIGGIGFMTLAITAITLTKRKIGLRERYTMQEALGAPQMSGIIRATRAVFLTTIIFELGGTILLALRFCPQFGFWDGLYYAVFHAVSAFCNAGFDLTGAITPNSSMLEFQQDPIVNIVLLVLLVFGSLGFFVWFDLKENRFNFRKYRLHTKIVLVTTLTLIFAGTFTVFLLEWNGTAFAGKTFSERWTISLFQAVSGRTAGFYSIHPKSMTDASQFFILCLMLIGGSPGSTAGGMKTTTFAVLFLSIFSVLKRKKHIECFKRRISEDTLRNAICLFMLYIVLFSLATIVICAVDDIPFKTALTESIAAISTAGLSMGITGGLSIFSKLLLAALMFFGRVGGLTILIAFTETYKTIPSQMPLEKITIG